MPTQNVHTKHRHTRRFNGKKMETLLVFFQLVCSGFSLSYLLLMLVSVLFCYFSHSISLSLSSFRFLYVCECLASLPDCLQNYIKPKHPHTHPVLCLVRFDLISFHFIKFQAQLCVNNVSVN